MNGVIRFKGKANTVRPDNFSGVIIKPDRGGNRVTGSPMNSTVTPGVFELPRIRATGLCSHFFREFLAAVFRSR